MCNDQIRVINISVFSDITLPVLGTFRFFSGYFEIYNKYVDL